MPKGWFYNWNTVCHRLAAVQCWETGSSVQEIARVAKVDPSTVRRWIKSLTGRESVPDRRPN